LINKFIDLTEIRQKIVYHNKNEGLIITTMLELQPVLAAARRLYYMSDELSQSFIAIVLQ
jgi:hypothetical protein